MDTLVESSAEEAGLLPDQIQRIDEMAGSWVGPDKTTESLVLLVARRGRVAYHKAFGQQSYKDPSPLSRDAIFFVASLAKVITASAAMQLVERGTLSLNRPVREYIPELSGKYTERLQVHQLLTHTSGFAQVHQPPLMFAPPETDVPCPAGRNPHVHKVLQAMFREDCFKKPGEQNMYCNENFLLVGEIIERVTGQDLEAQVQSHLFEPMGMENSSLRSFVEDPPGLCQRDPAESIIDREVLRGGVHGGGSFSSTAVELAAFGQMFLNGGSYNGNRLLHPWTTREMTRNQIPGIGAFNFARQWIPEGSWGFGWMIQGDARWPWSHGALQPRGTYYHQGGSGAAIWVDPLHELVGVYLSCSQLDNVTGNQNWEFDRFQNMVTAAVDYDA